jgi:hypothetical protein
MRDRDPLPLDDVDSERRCVEQDVREVVVEEVDLVDVEDAPVRLGEETRLERPLPVLQGAGDVDAARDSVLGCVQRQVDDAATAADDRQLVTRARTARGTRGLLGVARERTVGDDGDLREELSEAANRGRLARAARPLDQDAADRGIERVEQKCLLEAPLLDDRGEREVAGLVYVITSRFPKVGSACVIGGNCQVPISGTAVSRLTFTSIT